MSALTPPPNSPDFLPEEAVYVLAPAEARVPFLFSSPHSGRIYPERFLQLSRLDAHQIRRSEDCFVDQLIQNVVPMGATMIGAHFPRAYLDANREPFEMDRTMFKGAIPEEWNSRSIRVAGGLGTLPRIVGDGYEIYNNKLPVAEALMRVESCYVPYHGHLSLHIERIKAQFGYAVLVDCHSMPSQTSLSQGAGRPHIVLGDRYGHSASGPMVEALGQLFEERGYDVALNRPYAGGFITEHYGKPHQSVYAVQVELCRSLYLDEARYTPNRHFDRFRADLLSCFADLMALPDHLFMPPALAAE